MDNDTNNLLREMVMLQKEQNNLLKRYLWRLRFSLLMLLLLMTAIAVALGIATTKIRNEIVSSQKTSATPVTPQPQTSWKLFQPQPDPAEIRALDRLSQGIRDSLDVPENERIMPTLERLPLTKAQ